MSNGAKGKGKDALLLEKNLAIEEYEAAILSLGLGDEISARIKNEERDTCRIFDEFDLSPLSPEQRYRLVQHQKKIYELDDALTAIAISTYRDFDK